MAPAPDRPAPAPPGPARYILARAVSCAFAVALVLTAFWAAAGVDHAVRERAADLVTRAVLKPDITESRARALAESLKAEERGIETTIIGEAEARTLLSLQEPWMKDLPAVEIGRLPVLVEIRHPARFESAETVLAFNERLGKRPEVDFVEFNSLGFEGMIAFARNVRSYGSLLAAVIAGFAAAWHAWFALAGIRRTGPGGPGVCVVLALLISGLGYAAGLCAHFALAAFASSRIYHLPHLRPSALALVALSAFGLCLLLELRDVRARRPRRRPER